MSIDRIEKQVVLRAPLDRVWRAISDAEEFGQWFGVRFDGPFIAGGTVTAAIAPTTVDAGVAERQEAHAGVKRVWQIVAIEPQRRFAYRWHPFAIDPNVGQRNQLQRLIDEPAHRDASALLREQEECPGHGIDRDVGEVGQRPLRIGRQLEVMRLFEAGQPEQADAPRASFVCGHQRVAAVWRHCRR